MRASCSCVIFSGPVCVANLAKIRPFSRISRTMQLNFSALETAWRREADSNPVYRFTYSGFLNRQLYLFGADNILNFSNLA
jgi:hypothetical protein